LDAEEQELLDAFESASILIPVKSLLSNQRPKHSRKISE